MRPKLAFLVLLAFPFSAWACRGEIALGGADDTPDGSGGSVNRPQNACPDFQSVSTCQPAPGATSCTDPATGCGLDALPTGQACSGDAQCSLVVYPCPDWQPGGGQRTDGYICSCIDGQWTCDDCYEGTALCAEAGAPPSTSTSTTIPAGGSDAGPGTPVQLASIPGPGSIVVDANNAYVASYEIGPVYKVPLDGGPVTTLDAIGQNNVAINSASVYTVAGGGGNVPQGVVVSCAKTGCDGNYTTLATGQNGVWGVAADDTNVYWTNQEGNVGVFRAPIGGGPPTLLSGIGLAHQIVASAGWLFYGGETDSSGGEALLSISTVGGTPSVLVPPVSGEGVATIAVDFTNVYYATGGTLAQVPRAGGVSTILVPPDAEAGNPDVGAVAVDAARVYYVVPSEQAVKSVPIGGGTVTTLATEQASPTRIAVDADNVYWTNLGSNTVMKLAK